MSALIVAVAVCLGLFGVIMLAWGASRIMVANASRRWPICHGVIIESRVLSNRECNGLLGWQPVIRYRFVVDGKEYESASDEWRAGDFRYYTRLAAQRLADRYPVGTEVQVRYDPEELPCEAGGGYVTVLRPGWDPAMAFVIVVMVVSAAPPVALFVWAIVRLL